MTAADESLDVRVWAARLLDGTTPGPWEASFGAFVYVAGTHCQVASTLSHADAELITAAPDLARAVVDQAAEIERLRDAVWMDGDPHDSEYGECVFCFRPRPFGGEVDEDHAADCPWLAEHERRGGADA